MNEWINECMNKIESIINFAWNSREHNSKLLKSLKYIWAYVHISLSPPVYPYMSTCRKIQILYKYNSTKKLSKIPKRKILEN